MRCSAMPTFADHFNIKAITGSHGSACSNNARGKAEAVYRAAGFQKAAGNAIRISFSQDNTDEEVEELAGALRSLVS